MRDRVVLAVIGLLLAVATGCPSQTAQKPAPSSQAADKVTGTQMWQAACDGDIGVVQAGLAQGLPVDFQGDQGFTGLICASENGHLDVVMLMIEHHANVNNTDNARKKPALLAASFRSHDDIVSYLLNNAKPLVNWQAINSWTALHDAAYVGDATEVRDLLAHGADKTILNDVPETPLGSAKRALQECQQQTKNCPVTQGITKATPADYQQVISILQ